MNTPGTTSGALRFKQILFLVALLILSALVLGSFVRAGDFNFHRASFDDMVEGTAWKPFVYRALAPMLIRCGASALPPVVRDRLDVYAVLTGIPLTEFVVAMLLCYLSIIGFAWAFMQLARSQHRVRNDFLYVATIVAVAGLPAFFKIQSHLYDFPQLFLFTFCLLLLARGRWGWHLIVFGVATVNKETSILLVLVFVLHARDELSRRAFTLLIAAHLLIYAVVKTAITMHFMNNPGSFVEFHLHHNLFMAPYTAGQFTAFVLIGVAVFHRWREKPLFLRRSLWILAPLVVMALFFGNLQEYRVFYEAYPIVALLILHSIAHLLAVEDFQSWNKPSPS